MNSQYKLIRISQNKETENDGDDEIWNKDFKTIINIFQDVKEKSANILRGQIGSSH